MWNMMFSFTNPKRSESQFSFHPSSFICFILSPSFVRVSMYGEWASNKWHHSDVFVQFKLFYLQIAYVHLLFHFENKIWHTIRCINITNCIQPRPSSSARLPSDPFTAFSKYFSFLRRLDSVIFANLLQHQHFHHSLKADRESEM